MIDFLKFTFKSGWTFFGVLVLIVYTLSGIAEIIQAWRK